ncbi:MAG: 23S rRNA (adenine(2503)-C(2))-methyltransferase RlmN [Oscillospiraceae bacterium]|jgi:23S rRNA (adenine2503-C2)-methyltransferase|nr:23S rRNA (adenine(2503)-C(2))-methyltransferase RlmN [Oscillospiraceae bacterium]
MSEERKDIKSRNLDELTAIFAELGEPKFRAEQVFQWLHRGVRSFGEMTNLPRALREKLAERFELTAPTVERKQVSQKDGTIKYLWRLADGNCVETVVMEYEHGVSLCVSTQVGCRMGCLFCASSIGGLVRNLEPSEILDQVIFSGVESGKRISNIVLMGIGEPLDNFENVMRFLELVTAPQGLNIGMRHISLSTCGIIEKVDKLCRYHLQLTLSVSLHAADDETRTKIMPINKNVGVDRLFSACGEYFNKTGRRVSYEYALIRDVNDTAEHARELARRLRGTGSHVNLILLNPVVERGLDASTPARVREFTGLLESGGVNFTIRRRLGTDIDAACGQLRRLAAKT